LYLKFKSQEGYRFLAFQRRLISWFSHQDGHACNKPGCASYGTPSDQKCDFHGQFKNWKCTVICLWTENGESAVRPRVRVVVGFGLVRL